MSSLGDTTSLHQEKLMPLLDWLLWQCQPMACQAEHQKLGISAFQALFSSENLRYVVLKKSVKENP